MRLAKTEHKITYNIKPLHSYKRFPFKDGDHVLMTEKMDGQFLALGYKKFEGEIFGAAFTASKGQLKRGEYVLWSASDTINLDDTDPVSRFLGIHKEGLYEIARKLGHCVLLGEWTTSDSNEDDYHLFDIGLIKGPQIYYSNPAPFPEYSLCWEIAIFHDWNIVPILYDGPYRDGIIEEHMLDIKKNNKEGIVIRQLEPFRQHNHRLYKIKNPEYVRTSS